MTEGDVRDARRDVIDPDRSARASRISRATPAGSKWPQPRGSIHLIADEDIAPIVAYMKKAF
jgi:hypothetical protein